MIAKTNNPFKGIPNKSGKKMITIPKMEDDIIAPIASIKNNSFGFHIMTKNKI
jgi:hypothetical protein